MTRGKSFIPQTVCGVCVCKPGLQFINLRLEINVLPCGPDIFICLLEHAFTPSAAASEKVKLSKGCLVSVESVQEELSQ